MNSLSLSDRRREEDREQASRRRKQRSRVNEENERLKRRHREGMSGADPAMTRFRMGLPAWQEKNAIVEAAERSQVVVVSGMTGCGKSTQVSDC